MLELEHGDARRRLLAQRLGAAAQRTDGALGDGGFEAGALGDGGFERVADARAPIGERPKREERAWKSGRLLVSVTTILLSS